MLAYTFAAVAALLSLATPSLAATPTDQGLYTISPKKFPNMCLAPVTLTNGAAITVKNCDTSDDIVWQWTGQGWRNTAANKCFDIRDGATWNGNKFQVWDCFGYNTNQQYILPNEQIQWAGHNFCMDLTDGSGSTGVEMQIWNCFDHNDNQMWELTPAEEVEDCDGQW